MKNPGNVRISEARTLTREVQKFIDLSNNNYFKLLKTYGINLIS